MGERKHPRVIPLEVMSGSLISRIVYQPINILHFVSKSTSMGGLKYAPKCTEQMILFRRLALNYVAATPCPWVF